MDRRFVVADVFTDRPFGGNQLAVVLDAAGLDTAAMQAIAREFNFSETTFVLPPADPAHSAQVRIFTPGRELPFAGHPNVGTAAVLALEGDPADTVVFEEQAGLVPVRILRQDGRVSGAELTAPQPLQTGSFVPPELVAACLSLPPDAVVGKPVVASVGVRFILAELDSRDALRRAVCDPAAFRRLALPCGTDAIYFYTSDSAGDDGFDVHSRMFSPQDGIPEDPATGSATVALAALLALHGGPAEMRVQQGLDMGRPSTLLTRVTSAGTAHVGGHCVVTMRGVLTL